MKITNLKDYYFTCIYCPFPNQMLNEPKSSIYKYLRRNVKWDMFRKHMKEYHPDKFQELIKEICQKDNGGERWI